MKKTIITHLSVLLFILALGACADVADTISATTETLCTDGLDDDGDALIDCDDTDCAADAGCVAVDPGINGATDVDDDGDGYTEDAEDCDDNAATVYPGATETADDGIDQDCDGSDLSSGTDVDGDGYNSGTATTEDCNDSDGTINPAATEVLEDSLVDENCDGVILQATETSCTDGVDNNADGLTDCADTTTCASDASCAAVVTAEVCTGGTDEDSDTFIDCDDTDCAADTTNCPAAVTELSAPTLSATSPPLFNVLNGNVRFVDPTYGSDYLLDGVTFNDCATATAPCASLKAGLATVPMHGSIAVFDGTVTSTVDVKITRGVRIDGGFFWETLPDPSAGGGVIGFDPINYHSALELTGASLVINTQKPVVITNMGIVGKGLKPAVLIANASPTFKSCRIHASANVSSTLGVAVKIVSDVSTSLMRPTFMGNVISVGNVNGGSQDSAITVITAENTGVAFPMVLVLKDNRITAGKVSSAGIYKASSVAVAIIGNNAPPAQTSLDMRDNQMFLDKSKSSTAILGTSISNATIRGNSIFVKEASLASRGIVMASKASSITASADIIGNLISLNKDATATARMNTGILVSEFETTIASNTLVLGPAAASFGVSIDNFTSNQAVSMTNNFLQSNGVISSTMLSLTGVPTSLDVSYNGLHFATAPSTPYVFSNGTDTFATVVTGSSAGLEDTGAGLATLTSTYTGTLAVTGNLDIAADPLTWFGLRVILDATTGAALIDNGDPTLVPPAAARDINGKARVVNSIIDMGVAEAQP